MLHSAGIIPYRVIGNKRIQFFVGHATGAGDFWMFLKGQYNPEIESPEDAALREFKEESGLRLDKVKPEDLIQLGPEVKQRTDKMVIAFGLNYPNIDPKKCFSNLIDDGSGPEIDEYKWMDWSKLQWKTHRKHWMFYEKLLDIIREKLR